MVRRNAHLADLEPAMNSAKSKPDPVDFGLKLVEPTPTWPTTPLGSKALTRSGSQRVGLHVLLGVASLCRLRTPPPDSPEIMGSGAA